MLIGITLGNFGNIKPSDLLLIVQKMGVGFIEFNRSLLDDIETVSQRMQTTASGYHLPLVEEDGFDLSFRSRQQDIDRVVENLNRYGASLNLQYALTHPPQPHLTNHDAQSSIGTWIENLKRIRAPIFLENVVDWNEQEFDALATSLEKALGEQFAGICFDGPHSFLRGDDVFQRYRSLAARVKCFHLSDCSKTEDLHLPFGMGGVFPIEAFLKVIRDTQSDAIINLEIDPGSPKNLPRLIDSYLLVMKAMQPVRYHATRFSLLWRLPAIKSMLQQMLQEG